ncbi:peptide ABC transporter substrate-binding protein [Candidatus Clavichlamydia salmonicola]|uniref:peptide ABC transporter substrate-binding protein n=1 Tax=Candidatus Clavichlamydia salmonicola TaxID=469812 RepID=UPI001890B82A|nr:peptide ABC transporter substrate-binding protein [Candidatus Clavichlamydia salmonicola]
MDLDCEFNMLLKYVNTKASLLFAIFALLGSILSGCGKEKKTITPSSQKILTIPSLEDPISFDPRRITYIRDFSVLRHLFTGLWRVEDGKNIVPSMVKTVEISKDRQTYIISLKENFWSDNTPVTSYDFKESWAQVLSPNFSSVYSSIFYPIKNAKKIKEEGMDASQLGVETPSHDQLVIHLEYPVSYFEELMAFPTTFPVHHKQRAAGMLPLKQIISNGPFSLQQWEPQEGISLNKHPLYWDHENVSINQIKIKIIKNSSTAALMFQRGQLDWIGPPWYEAVLPEAMDQLRKNGKLNHAPLLGTSWLAVNLDHKYLKYPDIRHALSMAIDRKEIIKQALRSSQLPAHRILPPSLAHGDISTPSLTNKDEALKLFKKALINHGLSVEDFSSITLNYISSYITDSKISELIQKQWKEILGIHINIEPCEAKLFLEKRSSQAYDLMICKWVADFDDALPFLEIFQGQGSGKSYSAIHYTKFKNKAYDALLNQAIFASKSSLKKGFLLEAENILMKELPVLPIYYHIMEYAVSPKLQNFNLSVAGGVDLTHATYNEN